MKINITLPVYNEEKILADSVNTLIKFLKETNFPYNEEIVIADNASIDKTSKVAKDLSKKYQQVKYLFISKKGRGRALKQSWSSSNCDIASYMDIDLASDLKSLLPLVEAIAKDKCFVSIGSRLHKNSKVIGRSIFREILSRSYNLLIHLMFFTKFRDVQCGFKAVDNSYFKSIVHLIENEGWFFDTELLLISHHLNKKICTIPITWKNNSDSCVKIINTIKEYLMSLLKLKIRFIFGKIKN